MEQRRSNIVSTIIATAEKEDTLVARVFYHASSILLALAATSACPLRSSSSLSLVATFSSIIIYKDFQTRDRRGKGSKSFSSRGVPTSYVGRFIRLLAHRTDCLASDFQQKRQQNIGSSFSSSSIPCETLEVSLSPLHLLIRG